MFKAGELIDEKFEVVNEIGRGGMGVVLRVKQCLSSDEFALKHCEMVDVESRKRFCREVRFMSGISHSHVMPVLDQNLSHIPPYFTMPLAKGSLAQEIAMDLPEDDGLEAFKQLCLGIQAIHNANGTHRDIKPENAMRLFDGTVVVADLGLIKLDPRDTTVLTQTAAFVGTRVYCAPEQLIPGGSREADSRTDIFQLGKTLYELIAREPPALINNERIPPGLAYIVERATQQHPDHRYQTVGALLDAVQNYILAKMPDASPDREFEAALQEAVNFVHRGQYGSENLERLLDLLLRFEDDPDVLLEQFDRLPDEFLPVMARNFPIATYPVLEAYRKAVEAVIENYNFSYAEVVANKMKAIFSSTENSALKALAVRATLVGAVKCNRFAAMDVLSSMLTSIDRLEDAVAIADVLREELFYYEVVASQVPKSKLHVALHAAYNAAIKEDHH